MLREEFLAPATVTQRRAQVKQFISARSEVTSFALALRCEFDSKNAPGDACLGKYDPFPRSTDAALLFG